MSPAVVISARIFAQAVTVTVAVLLCSMTQAKPVVVVVKRAAATDTIATRVNQDRLANPCVTETTVATSDVVCSALDMEAVSAKTILNTLHATVSSVCVGSELANLKVPEISDKTRDEKLRAIYNSLVSHNAYLQAIASSPNQTESRNLFNSSISSLTNLMCTLQCHLRLSASDRQSAVDTAKQLMLDTSIDQSGLHPHTCIATKNATRIIDLLTNISST